MEPVVEHWRAEGLLPGFQPVLPPCSRETCWNDVPEPAWAARWSCRFGGLVVSFSIQPRFLVANIRTLFRHLEIGETSADLRLEVRLAGTAEAVLLADGVERVRAKTSEPGAFKDGAHRMILEKLNPETDWYALVHAGALICNGKGIVLPASSGSGKTTLIAFLMSRGYSYLADDLVALASPGARILPWPLPMSVKSASVDLLMPLHPALSNAFTFRTKGDVARLLLPPAECWNSPRIPFQTLIFPQFKPDAVTSLQRISPLEALQRIIQGGAWFGHPLRGENIRMFLGWIAAAPSFVLTFSRLQEAAEAMEGL